MELKRERDAAAERIVLDIFDEVELNRELGRDGANTTLWRHHDKNVDSVHIKLSKWNEVIQLDDPHMGRCHRCWTRQFQCYCVKFNESIEKFNKKQKNSSSSLSRSGIVDTEIIMYLSAKELGRTANTAHVLEELIPENCSRYACV